MKDALIKYETIEVEQIKQLMNRQPVTAPDGWSDVSSNQQTPPTAKAEPQQEKSVAQSLEENDSSADTPENKD